MLSLLFLFPVESTSGMAGRKRRRSIPGGVRLIQIRLYSFCEKGHHFVKTNSQRLPKSSGVAGYICSELGVVRTLTPRLAIPVTVFPLARVTRRFFSKLGSLAQRVLPRPQLQVTIAERRMAPKSYRRACIEEGRICLQPIKYRL